MGDHVNATLDAARVSYRQTLECQHVLAAANHYQWIRWERYVIPLLEAGNNNAIDQLLYGDLPEGLNELLKADAETVIDLVETIVGGFAWPVPRQLLYARKLNQLSQWVNYARSCDESAYDRWKLQCKTKFLFLTPKQQESDYIEAVSDFHEVAKAGGLVMPRMMPHAIPQAETVASLRRFRHLTLGWHGNYTRSIGWARKCVACHGEISGFTP
jgi:hypothetical protein